MGNCGLLCVPAQPVEDQFRPQSEQCQHQQHVDETTHRLSENTDNPCHYENGKNGPEHSAPPLCGLPLRGTQLPPNQLRDAAASQPALRTVEVIRGLNKEATNF